MLNSPYAYQIELCTPEGTAIGRAALTVDWEPAREWTRFAAVRAGRIPPSALDVMTTIQPIWHAKANEPYVDGFGVVLTIDGTEVTHAFSTEYFARSARAALEALCKSQGLKGLDTVRYVTTAYPASDAPRAGAATAFVTREIASDLSLRDGSVDEIAARAVAHGETGSGDMPVFVPHRLLEEAASLTKTAGPKETGGILIGHLYWDRHRSDLFAEVTAQIPARHTEANLTTLTFTAETWTAVRRAIALRARFELMLGWWHSHPVREWCKACPPERQRVCSLGAGFLSAHDRALHRTVFPRAYSLALVVNDVAVDGPTFSLFGWREGVLDHRGFAVLDGSPEAYPSRSSTVVSHDAGDAQCRVRASATQ